MCLVIEDFGGKKSKVLACFRHISHTLTNMILNTNSVFFTQKLIDDIVLLTKPIIF